MRNRIVTAVKQRFSIRKLSIGAASVLLGTSLYFMGGSATVVHADTNVSGNAPQTETSKADVQVKLASAGVDGSSDQQKAPTNDKIDKNKLDSIARNKNNDDTTVNDAIDKYAQQEEVGDNALIRASGKEPTTPANTADERGDQVDSIAKKLDDDVKNANSNQEQTAISNYINARHREGFSNITDGKEAKDFADQGLSVDDEKDSEINQITVDHNDITLLKGQSEKIDGIDVTHTNKMTKKEKNDMKINSDNKVIIDLQHDQCQDKEITVTYDNLNNSYYLENINNKTNKIKISKIERTFSDIQPGNTIFTSDGIHEKNPTDGVYDKCDGPQLIIYNDPSDGFFYNNITQVSVKDIYYDDQGSQIKFDTKNDKNKAWIFVTSLNSNGGGNVEKVSAQGANVEKIAGSTVTNHNGWWYSDKNNWFNKNPDWDNKDEDNRYGFVGTVAVQYHPGMKLQYRADDSYWGSHWACMQTQVVSSLKQRVIIYDHIKDNVEPKKVTNKWSETIHYVIPDDSSKAPKAPEDNVQYSNWGRTETIDQITGNTVEDGEYDTDWKLQPGEKKYYDEVVNKRIDGYHTKEKSVAQTPVIPGPIEKTVIYYPNGKIIPVDKSNNPIPGADQPVFPTDLNDPTKTVDGEIPAVKGYHPEKGKPGDLVAPKKDPGEDVPVVYVEDDQIAQIIYRDVNDTDNTKWVNIDTSGDITGKAGTEIKYDPQSKIQELVAKGYKLTNNGFPAGAVFDNDSNKTQTFYIDFIHGRTTVTQDKPGEPGKPINPKDPNGPKWPDGTDKAGLTKTGTQTIQYVGAGDKTPAANTQQYTFSKSMVIDKVTGKVLDQGSWNIDSHTFGTVNTPVIPGYQADKAVAGGETVTPDDLNKVVTVSYTKVADQLAQIIYRDDDDNDKVLATDDSSGKAGSEINYDPQSHIDQFINKGYELKNNGFPAGAVFDNDSNKTQTFYIDFIHGRTTVTQDKPGEPGKPINPKDPNGPKWPDGTDKAGLTKTGTQTIQYVGAGDKTPAANTQQYTFSKSMVIDKVTGKVLDQGSWNIDSHTFGTVNTPVIPGYQADKAVAGGETVTPDDLNKVVTVTYAPDVKDVTTVVHYIDEDQNNTVIFSSENLTGKEGTQIGYKSANDLKALTDKGYVLDVNGYDPDGKAPNFDSKVPVYEIKLKHGRVTVTPENPGKPDNPINPNYPNGPKWPDGTDKDSLTKTGTQTIRYVGAGDKTPADNTQTYIFNKSMVIDKVTGKVLDPGSWNIDSYTFGTVKTPVIPGYHADKDVAGGATVTPADLNKVIIVTYAPDGGSGDNPGSNGGGDQGTTPTPESVPEPTPSPDDQPDTTLPSDNNTDKDVEKDKQDKPEEVKKARKIIKTRITKQEHIGNAEKAEPLAEQEHNDQTVASPVKNEANEPQLPQTGEANTSVIGLLGMLGAGFAAILGFESSRSRKHKN